MSEGVTKVSAEAGNLAVQIHDIFISSRHFDQSMMKIARLIDEHAQQREQAAYERGKAEGREAGKQEERGRVREALEAEEKSNFRLADVAHERGNLRQELIYSAARSAFKKAINIVNQE